MVQKQLIVLMMAQFILAAIQALNYRFAAMVVLLLLLLFTGVYGRDLTHKYAKVCNKLPFETCCKLDLIDCSGSLPSPGTPRQLNAMLASASEEYTAARASFSGL